MMDRTGSTRLDATRLISLAQLEWMSEDIGRAFDLQRSNPFELRNVHIIHSLEELDELGNDPQVKPEACEV